MDRKLLFYTAIFGLFFSIFVFLGNGHYGGDGLENYLTAESIVLDGDLKIYDRPFEVKEMRAKKTKTREQDGARYSKYGIGMPLLLVPLYGLGQAIASFIPGISYSYVTQFCVALTNPLITALTVLMLFVFLENLGYEPRTCFFTVLCYAFSTMVPAYARSGFSEPAVTFFVLSAVFFLHKHEKSSLTRYLVLAAVLVGYTLLIKINSLIYLPMMFGYAVYRSKKEWPGWGRSFRLWMAVILPLAFAVGVALYVRTLGGAGVADATVGSFNRMFRGSIGSMQSLVKGLYYNLFSSGKGYFFYNVPLVLALFAVKDFLRKNRTIAMVCLIFIVTNFFVYSFIFKRGSLFSWGPRYLYPTIPFMCVFLAQFIDNARSVAKKIAVAAAGLIGCFIQLPVMFINVSKYLFFVKEKLMQEEYFINYVPHLSPLYGNWRLFLSAITRSVSGVSLSFTYDPDYWFLKPIIVSLKGYDVWDIWWVNAVKVSPRFSIMVLMTAFLLVFVMILCLVKIKRTIFVK